MSSRSYVVSKFRKIAAQLPYIVQALRLVWYAAPRHSAVWAAFLVFQGLLPVATVYLSRALVNGLVAVVRSPSSGAITSHTMLLAAAMGALILIGEAARVSANWLRTSQAELVQDHISDLIQRKSVAVDLAFYDNAEFYDHLHRARSQAGYRPIALLENLGSIFQNGITLASMVVVVIPFGAWVPMALLVSTLPALFVVLRHAMDQHHWRQRVTSDERRTSYYDWLLTAGECAAEIRLFGLGEHFQSAFRTLRTRLRTERSRLTAKQGVAELAAGLFVLVVSGVSIGWTAWRVFLGKLTLGDLALFYQAFQQGLMLSRSLLENVGQLYGNALFLGDLFEFLGLKARIVNTERSLPAAPVRTSIRFRRVSFRYPGTDRFALKDLDLEIPAGQITAIVGTNGAGKSTLIKLLSRFYDPESGVIELDGADLRSLELETLRRSISLLFQQPVRYNATAAENIAFGDMASFPHGSAIQNATEAAGAAGIIAGLPEGYEQVLGRWFENGAELSGGQWQRIALARAFLRQSPILILDEPTSAMDPWASADWLRRFRQLAAGRTAIVITHRFTTAMIAETIHVMSEGRVIESGSHGQLLAAGGRYAQGWIAQTTGCLKAS